MMVVEYLLKVLHMAVFEYLFMMCCAIFGLFGIINFNVNNIFILVLD